MKLVQMDWEGQPQTEEYWNNLSRQSHPRDVLSSVSMKSGAQQVLDQQM